MKIAPTPILVGQLLGLASTTLLATYPEETGNDDPSGAYGVSPLSPALLLQAPQWFPESFDARRIDTGDVYQHMRLEHLPGPVFDFVYGPNPLLDPSVQRPLHVWHNSMCGPCTIANGLQYFDRNGFPDLIPDFPGFSADHQQLLGLLTTASLLASPDFINTHEEDGSNSDGMIAGTIDFVRSRGYDISHVEIRHMNPNYDQATKFDNIRSGTALDGDGISVNFVKCKPSLAFLKSALQEEAIVALNWGSFQPFVDPSTIGTGNEPPDDPWATWDWNRTGGHWIAPIGYGVTDTPGFIDPNTISFHDSAGSDDDLVQPDVRRITWSKLENLPGNPELLSHSGVSWDDPNTPEDESVHANGFWAFRTTGDNPKTRILAGVLVMYLSDPHDDPDSFSMADFLGTNGRDHARWRAPRLSRNADGSYNYSYVVAPDVLHQGIENFSHTIQTTTDGRRWLEVNPQPNPDLPGHFEATFQPAQGGFQLFRAAARPNPTAPQ